MRPVLLALALLLGPMSGGGVAHAESADQVVDWISAYSARYSSADYLYVDLFRDSLRVARCESAGFDSRVLNNVRRGARGEVGVGQFLPTGIWWYTPQADAGYSMFDVEANTAALVWSIAHGLGPRHWVWCWRNG